MTQEPALILLGCPEVPVQTSVALYLAYKLKENGLSPVIAGTRAARNLVQLADPQRHYAPDYQDLEECIAEMAEKKKAYRMCFVFIHNDAGVSYAATVSAVTDAKVYAVVYGRNAADLIAELEELPVRVIGAPATHNPMPLKKQMDRVMQWGA
jgi:hypothetical protein